MKISRFRTDGDPAEKFSEPSPLSVTPRTQAPQKPLGEKSALTVPGPAGHAGAFLPLMSDFPKSRT